MQPPTEPLQQDSSRSQTAPTAPPPVPVDGRPARPETPALRRERSGAWRKWLVWLGIPCLVVLAIVLWRWWALRPPEVSLIQPALTAITETIASSGRVHGMTETIVGAQSAGIVERLFVAEGDRVTAGQPIAVLQRDVAEARVAQAEQAIKTARAQLAQVERGPLPSEV
jgi:HlyD family secretion protein